MGLFDLLRAAVQPAAAARAGYLEGQEYGRQQKRKDYLEDEELALKKAQQASQDEEARARAEYYRAFGRQKDSIADEEPVSYQVVDGQLVQVPTRRRKITPSSDASSGAAPFDSTMTQEEFDRGLTGGPIAPARDQGKSPFAMLKSAVTGDQQSAQQPTQATPGSSGVRAIGGVSVGQATPRTPPRRDRVVGNDGYYYTWDEATQRYVQSNVKAPPKAYEFSPNAGRGGGSNAEARLRAQAALTAAEKDVPRPSKVPEPKALIPTQGPDGKLKMVPNPAYGDRMKDPEYARTVNDSLAYERDVLKPLRDNLFSVTVPELNTKGAVPVKHDTTGNLSATRTTLSKASGTPVKLTPEDQRAMNAEMQRAADNANAILNSPAPDALKARARELLSRQLKAIARKYGATNP